MDVKEKNPSVPTGPKRFLDNFLTCRRVLNIMVFLGFMVNYMLRVNLTFAIVDMVLRSDDSNITISTTPFPNFTTTSSQNRLIRSLLNAELADAFTVALTDEDDDDDDDDEKRKFRKKNMVGTAPPKQSATFSKPPSGTGTPGRNQFGGFQSSSRGSGNDPGGFQSVGSSSGANQNGGFQSSSGSSGTNSNGGFQSSSGSSGTNSNRGFQSSSGSDGSNGGFQSSSGNAGSNGGFQSSSGNAGSNGGFQSSSGGSNASPSSESQSSNGNVDARLSKNNPVDDTTGNVKSSGNLGVNEINKVQSSNKQEIQSQSNTIGSGTSQSNGDSQSNTLNTSSQPPATIPQPTEPTIEQTKVVGLNSGIQGSGETGTANENQSSDNSKGKVGLAPNSLDDYIVGEETKKDSHILFVEDSNKKLPEIGSAILDTNQTSTAAPKKKKKTRHQKPNVQRFRWSEAQQGVLIGSFFWGYICTELPGGRLAEIIGARKVFGYATLGASVVTLLTPMFAKIHFILVVIIRILLGLFLGPTWPSILPLAGKWIPLDERGKFLSNMMGSTLGAGFTLPVCGFIIDTLSWEYVFYITGLLGFIWSIVWFLLVFETPAEHPRITPEERRYIESRLGLKSSKNLANSSNEEKQIAEGLVVNPGDESCLSDNDQKSSDECPNYSTFTHNGNVKGANSDSKDTPQDKKSSTGSIPNSNNESVKKSNGNQNVIDKNSAVVSNTSADQNKINKQSSRPKAPWIHIITSIPVWAFVLTHGASVFGYNTITNQLPTFMNAILDYEIKENGILSSFPYIGKYIAAVIGGAVADKLLRSSRFTKNFIRKLLTCIGVLIPGLLMLFQIFVGNEKVFSIFVFTAALTANGVVVGGYLGNSLDIAPNFSGTVFGLGNMFSGISGAVSALLVGYLTDHNQVYGQWQKVFFIVGATYIIGALIFLIFGSTEVQPWNNLHEEQKKTEGDSDVDEGTGILQASRRQGSACSAIRSYTEDEWDTSSYVSSADYGKSRKKRHRKKNYSETETESFESSKKHSKLEPTSDVSTLRPLISNEQQDSDSVNSYYTDGRKHKDVELIDDVKLRKSRNEYNEDYLSSVKKRASYKEAIENTTSKHERKIKNRSDSNESEQSYSPRTSEMKENTRKQDNQPEENLRLGSTNEKRNRRYKSRNISDDEYIDEKKNKDDHQTKRKRESRKKKLKSPPSQQSVSSESENDEISIQKRDKKHRPDDTPPSQSQNAAARSQRKKLNKKNEDLLEIDVQPSTSANSNQNKDIDESSSGVNEEEPKQERNFFLPLSPSSPTKQNAMKHASSSPI